MAPDSDSAVRSWRAPILLATAVIVADQLSKHWALNRLSGDRIIDVVWTLRFNLAFNNGMAFSFGDGMGPLIAVVATVVIVWLLVSLRTAGGRLNAFGIGCVIGGAAGNLIDRAFRQEAWLRGSVVDFIDFQWFPIFNVADMAINVGAGALILNALLAARRDTRSTAADAESADVESADVEAIDVDADAAPSDDVADLDEVSDLDDGPVAEVDGGGDESSA